MTDKMTLRKQLLSHERVLRDDGSVLVHLISFLRNTKPSRTCLIYTAVKSSSEIDVSSLSDLLPNVSFDTVGNKKDALFPTKKYDVIVIPVVGFNRDGFRLGRGGGWYDRFLASQPSALKIGVGHESSLVDFTPEPHDIAMDIVVTEQEIRDFRVK